MTIEDYFIQKNTVTYIPHSYKTIVRSPGRFHGDKRKKHYYKLAKELKVKKTFVTELFKQESYGGKTIDIGSKIRTKAGVYKKKKIIDLNMKTPDKAWKTQTLSKRMAKIVTRKQECTAKTHPLCLKVFITNKEDTVCLRCK